MNDQSPVVRTPPTHAEQMDFCTRNGILQVASTPVTTLLDRSQGRPFYAYDTAVMSRTVANLRTALPERVTLHYAMKANPMPGVVTHMAGLTGGLDVASCRELAIALKTKTAPRDISFAGPGKSEEDLRAAVAGGVLTVLESTTEAQRVAAIAAESGLRVPVAVRVNPDFQLKSSGMKMGGGAQPFGIDAELIPDVLQSLKSMPLDVHGFHIFSGSQNLRPESIIEAQRETLQLAARLAVHLPEGLRWLNIGGGLGVPYFPGDVPLDLNLVMPELDARLIEHAAVLHNTEVVMELGRYLVAAAGIYVCQVTDIKESRGTKYLITNGGLHHHLAVTGNFGQVIRKNYPVAIANRMDSGDVERVTIVGPLCTPLDLLAKDMLLPKAEIGDAVAIFMSGAYGYSASPHGFLSHPEPMEFCL